MTRSLKMYNYLKTLNITNTFLSLIMMTSHIAPSDSFIRFLVPPVEKPVPMHITNIIPSYRITHLLGSGGSADVYKALDENGKSVAIKIPLMKIDATIDASVYDRFKEEADLWRNLAHPNIVRFHSGNEQPLPHITMELMEGGSLRLLLKNHRMSVGESLHVIIQVLEGLSYAHRMATVHRDLKPENILFDVDGVTKITDWGIGKFMLSASLSKTRGTKGTMNYSAPEQFDKKRYGKVDWQTDIFQVGIVLYEMLTGVNPFSDDESAGVMGKVLGYDPDPPSSRNPAVPEALDDIVMGALAKIKGHRWRSADVMLFQLREIIAGREVSGKKGKREMPQKDLSRKAVSERQYEKLEQRLDEFAEMDLDTSELDKDRANIKRYRTMGWWNEAITSTDKMLKDLQELYQQHMKEITQRRDALRRNVKRLFSHAFFRNINVENLFERNRKAREAMEEGDLHEEEIMNRSLHEELERIIEEHSKNMEHEDRVRKHGQKVLQLREKARIYGLDVKDEDNIIISATALLKGGKLELAEKIYSKVEKHFHEIINRYENAVSVKRKGQYRSVWKDSKKMIMIRSTLYMKKLFGTKKEIKEKLMEERTNFIGMAFMKVPDRNFYVARYPVTQKEWRVVMGNAPWKGQRYEREADDIPATYVTWHDANDFVDRLNEMEGVDRYQLPTEKEWEHAARAGCATDFSFGNEERKLEKYAWYQENAEKTGEKYAHKVGRKRPNPWGLYDVHGNVWEWCLDEYKRNGSARVIRGGSWDDRAEYCRSGERHGNVPEYENNDVGFRIIRDI